MSQPAFLSTAAFSGNASRMAVVLLGVLVCALLFFADKSSLENQVEAGLQAAEPSASAAGLSTEQLPPLPDDPGIVSLAEKLAQAQGGDRLALLDSLSSALASRGRLDMAALYAGQALELDSSLSRQVRAGVLYQQAMELPFVQEDSGLVRAFSRQAIAFLEKAQQAGATDQEDVLLSLGLAYVQSGVPENSMKGILSIRRVLELNPQNVEAGFRLGEFSLQTGQFDKAAERFQAVLSAQPDRFDAKLGLATAYLNLGQQAQAKPLLEEVVQHSPDQALRLRAGAMLDNIR